MKKWWQKILKRIGPGFITGASDDDPSGIITYSQTGAIFGYTQLWLTPLCFPIMAAIQEMSGRIGMVTGKGLSALLKRYYPKWLLYTTIALLFIANTINIAADLGAMAASLQMTIGLPFAFWMVFVSIFIVIIEIFVSYNEYSKILKFFCLSLLAYFFTAFVVHQDWGAIMKSTIVPQFIYSKEYFLNIVAFLGTSITPYCFFWQTSEEVEEEVVNQNYDMEGNTQPKVTKDDIKEMREDTFIGMGFSQLATFMIVLTTAATLHVNGILDIQTAPQAAQALRPLAGDLAYLLFAVGIIGTGLLAIPILAGANAYAIAEAAGWREGLGKKLKDAPLFYGIIAVSTLIGLLMNFIGINPMVALYYSAAVNGVIAPILIFVILAIGRNKKIMGEHANGKLSTIFNSVGALIMGVSAVFLLINL